MSSTKKINQYDKHSTAYDWDLDIYVEWKCPTCGTWNSETRKQCRQQGCATLASESVEFR